MIEIFVVRGSKRHRVPVEPTYITAGKIEDRSYNEDDQTYYREIIVGLENGGELILECSADNAETLRVIPKVPEQTQLGDWLIPKVYRSRK